MRKLNIDPDVRAPITAAIDKIDPHRTPQFGLVAEDVEKVNPDLVIRNSNGNPYTVRYDAVNAMLLNEFLKAHRKIQELEASNAQQQKQIDVLTAGLQKVSAELERSKPATQTCKTDGSSSTASSNEMILASSVRASLPRNCQP
jgi:hypothetical protein